MSNIMEKKIDLFYYDMYRLLKKYKFEDYCFMDTDVYNDIISTIHYELQNLLKSIFHNKILEIIGFEFKELDSTVYVCLVNRKTGQYIYNKADFKEAIMIPVKITIDFKKFLSDEE